MFYTPQKRVQEKLINFKKKLKLKDLKNRWNLVSV